MKNSQKNLKKMFCETIGINLMKNLRNSQKIQNILHYIEMLKIFMNLRFSNAWHRTYPGYKKFSVK